MSPVAHLALLSWPLVTALLFARLRMRAALVWTILGGVLFLPDQVGYNLPAVPTIDKSLLPALLALLFCAAAVKKPGWMGDDASRVPRTWLPVSPLGRLLVVLLLTSPFLTGLTNTDYLPDADRPGLGIVDIGNMLYSQLELLLVVVLGRRFLSDDEGTRALMIALAIGMLMYVPLIFYEVRMSPQLNNQIYGFVNMPWHMMTRDDGWRPLVFLKLGLMCAIFVAVGLIAATAIARHLDDKRRTLWMVGAFALLVTLFFMRSFGALVLGVGLVMAVLFLGKRLQLWLAAGICSFVLVYPIMQALDIFPDETTLAAVEVVDYSRSRSLWFRLHNEDLMIEKLNERPLFGWGIWGRSRVYEDGYTTNITDSTFIIAFSQNGWWGFLGQYGLLTLPAIMIWRYRRRYQPDFVITGLALVQCAFLLDSLSNNYPNPMLWLVAGALLGHAERAREAARDRRPAADRGSLRGAGTAASSGSATGPHAVPAAPSSGTAVPAERGRTVRSW
ncbi:MAG: hypothetical protein ACFBWO_18850 [Paracoccaceae bacterium]